MKDKGITVTKEKDMPEWYSQVALKSKLADYSRVKGTMVIRPYGFAVWQKIQDEFNKLIAKNNVENAYFPLFIPESFFKKEAEHAKGFSPEVAWIEKKTKDKERIAIRPTSETIMYDSYSRWIRSWRDLPLKINQWCNVVRWEVSDVKLFLRSREFLWQEGHCVYETEKECETETLHYLNLYKKISKDLLAVPALVGKKTEKEKFAGAKTTYGIETFTEEGKALQLATSHNLGQSFAKGFNIKFKGRDDKTHLPWQNSWGFSTRLIGALIMTHSDNKGLVLPPTIAPNQIVIIPILKKDSQNEVLKKARQLKSKLKKYRVLLDDNTSYSSGWKFNEYELRGVPLRLEIGPKDIKKKQVVIARRDNGKKESIKESQLLKTIDKTLNNIQVELFRKASKFLEASIINVETWNDFKKVSKDKKLIKASFCGRPSCEEEIKFKTSGITSRLELLNEKKPKGKCINCDKLANQKVIFGKTY